MHFYGPAPHPSGNWLKLELRLFRAHVAMLPRLRAEEQLAGIQRGHAFVERPMAGRARSSYVAELERSASGGQRTKRPLSKGDLGVLANMGIAVRRVGTAVGESA